MGKESGEVVKFAETGMPQLEVWLEDETIWLTQKQMAELFGCAPQNITYHLRKIFKIGELTEAATCKEFLQVQIEGGRRISRLQKFYNLDAIISVGNSRGDRPLRVSKLPNGNRPNVKMISN